MFVPINGAFAVGKATVARALRESIPKAVIYDPELIGIALQRLGSAVGARPIDDFQHLAAWRRATAAGARLWHARGTPVIVPMAFSNLAHLRELTARLERTAAVRIVCLQAPLAVVEERLRARASAHGASPGEWILRRARECCAVQRNRQFGMPVDALGPVAEIVARLNAMLRGD